jgi:hypothetical protein
MLCHRDGLGLGARSATVLVACGVTSSARPVALAAATPDPSLESDVLALFGTTSTPLLNIHLPIRVVGLAAIDQRFLIICFHPYILACVSTTATAGTGPSSECHWNWLVM